MPVSVLPVPVPVSVTSNALKTKNNALFGHNSRLNNKVAVSIKYQMFSVLVNIAGIVHTRMLSSWFCHVCVCVCVCIYIYIYIYM